MTAPTPARRRGLFPALGLFLLAPLFGEFLLGNLTVADLALLPFLAVLYGAGAVLIRETARRFGRGSATMLVLGVAYALVEEGLVDQMLFNQDYFAGQAEGSDTVIAALGIDAWLTIVVVAMHAVWSTYIPITVVESLVPARRSTPWLGPVGLAVTSVVFVGGSVWIGWESYRETGFFASAAQLTGTSLVVVALVVAAFAVPRRAGGPPAEEPAPRAWLAGVFAFASASLFMPTEALPGWLEVAAALLIVVVFGGQVLRWSRRRGFGERHRLALVTGGVLTYAWLGLTMEPETGPRSTSDQVGSVFIAGFAILLLVLAFRRSAPVGDGACSLAGRLPGVGDPSGEPVTNLRGDRVAEVARHLAAAERSLAHQRAAHAGAFRHSLGRLLDGLERAHVHCDAVDERRWARYVADLDRGLDELDKEIGRAAEHASGATVDEVLTIHTSALELMGWRLQLSLPAAARSHLTAAEAELARYRNARDTGAERSADALERHLNDLRHTTDPAVGLSPPDR